jgi:GDP-L-fucose synthase
MPTNLYAAGTILIPNTATSLSRRFGAFVEFSRMVAATVGYTGEIRYDTARPHGTPRKLLDGSRPAKFGWRASASLETDRSSPKAYQSEFEQAAE